MKLEIELTEQELEWLKTLIEGIFEDNLETTERDIEFGSLDKLYNQIVGLLNQHDIKHIIN
jgi:hypothetical protein